MAKDPAVLLYTQDFLVGTMTMDYEQKGKYIHLLCLQHQKTKLTKKDLHLVLTDEDVEVFEKFYLDTDGFYYNIRMKEEADKRANFTKSRRDNGNRGGRPKTTIKPNDIPYDKPKDNLSVNHMVIHMEDENVNVNVNEIGNGLVDKILDRILQTEDNKLHREAIEDLEELGGLDKASEIMNWDSSQKQNWLRAINQAIQIHNNK
jgi:hypothetical protein